MFHDKKSRPQSSSSERLKSSENRLISQPSLATVLRHQVISTGCSSRPACLLEARSRDPVSRSTVEQIRTKLRPNPSAARTSRREITKARHYLRIDLSEVPPENFLQNPSTTFICLLFPSPPPPPTPPPASLSFRNPFQTCFQNPFQNPSYTLLPSALLPPTPLTICLNLPMNPFLNPLLNPIRTLSDPLLQCNSTSTVHAFVQAWELVLPVFIEMYLFVYEHTVLIFCLLR